MDLTPSTRHRKLIEKITHRGPTAYRIFEKILKEYFPDAASILTNSTRDVSIRERMQRFHSQNGQSNETNNHSTTATITTTTISSSAGAQAFQINHGAEPAQPMQPNRSIQPIAIPNTSKANNPTSQNGGENGSGSGSGNRNDIEFIEYDKPVYPKIEAKFHYSTKIHGLDVPPKVGIYEMQSNKRGIFVLVNNIHFKRKRRNGAETDRDNLVHLFRQMQFKVYVFEDMGRDVSSEIQ